MRIGPYTRLGPDLHTTWGTYPSPYITQPASAVMRPWMPPTIRGRHQYRVQPRMLTTQPLDPVRRNGVIGDLLNRGRASLVPGSPGYGATEAAPVTAPAATADPQKETKIGLYLLLGVAGLLGWLAFGTKRNPSRRGKVVQRRHYKVKPYFVVFPVYEDLWTKWFWRAYRGGKSIETEGPFRTQQDAIDDGKARGYTYRRYYRVRYRS